jgi:hypothetical protein
MAAFAASSACGSYPETLFSADNNTELQGYGEIRHVRRKEEYLLNEGLSGARQAWALTVI